MKAVFLHGQEGISKRSHAAEAASPDCVASHSLRPPERRARALSSRQFFPSTHVVDKFPDVLEEYGDLSTLGSPAPIPLTGGLNVHKACPKTERAPPFTPGGALPCAHLAAGATSVVPGGKTNTRWPNSLSSINRPPPASPMSFICWTISPTLASSSTCSDTNHCRKLLVA